MPHAPDGPTTRVILQGGEPLRMIRSCSIEVIAPRPVAGARAVVDRLLFRVGSHPSNDLVIADDTISKHHLELSITDGGYRLVDLASSNGTFLDTTRIGDVTVTEPVTLRLGAVTIHIEPMQHEAPVPASRRVRFGTLVGSSLPMRELYEQLERVAASDATLLIEGETGVGKSEVAESVHRESRRGDGPFVVVDCAALVGELAESELFGHLRGAFSGATSDREGLIAEADGGTLFLDEVGDLAPALQAKLLGALERRKVTPLGTSAPRAVDVRVIAASQHDLARAVNLRRFRADLFFRLAVVRVRMPPLRDRLDDIPALVTQFLEALRAREGADVPTELSTVVLARLAAQPWPGNVRELRNAVERAALRLGSAAAGAAPRQSFADARERVMAEFERRFLLEALERSGQNVSEAARQAGVERRNFQRLLRRHQIVPAR